MTKTRHRATKSDRPTRLVFLGSGMPIRRSPAPLARRFAQICTGVLAEALAHADLTPLQYAVFNHLDVEPDIDQIGLAMRLGVDRTSAGQLVDQLESRGLVERRINGADRRARLLRLTRAGEKLNQHLHPPKGSLSDRVLAPLAPAEREIFLNLLVRIIEGNEAYAHPGAGRRKPSRTNHRIQTKHEGKHA
jgi:DNA-binding MarR family transcriptional regulator